MLRGEILLSIKVFILRLQANFSTFRGGGFLSNHSATTWPLMLLGGRFSCDIFSVSQCGGVTCSRSFSSEEGERRSRY